MTHMRRMAVWLCCCSVLWLSGCRKAAVERGQTTVQTNVQANEPAYVLRPAKETEAPWRRELQVVFDSRPADVDEMNAILADRKPVVSQAAQGLLQQIRSAVEGRRKSTDKWSVLALSLGRARKASDILFTAEVVLAELYTPRPAMAFDSLPLELCVAKLAREAGIAYSQPRGYSPLITWSKTDVSAFEALSAILAEHGFECRFTNASYKIGLRIEDLLTRKEAASGSTSPAEKEGAQPASLYPTRADFVKAAADAILAKGDELNRKPASVTVWLKEEKEKKPAPAPAPKTPPDSKAR